MHVVQNFPPEQLESCLLQLLAPDTAMIKQAEVTLKGYMKQVSSVGGFMMQIQHSQHAQVRQMAAILLRKKINVHWNHLDQQTQTGIKSNLLNLAAADQERLVRNALVQLIGCISKHQVPSGAWPELLAFITQTSQSPEENHRELAMNCFYCLTETIGEHLEQHFHEIKQMFMKGLQDVQSLRVRTMAMKASCSLLGFLSEGDEVLEFQELIQPMIEVLKLSLSNGDETEAMEFLDVFGDIAESSLPVLNPCMKPFVHCLLETMLNDNLEVSTRDSAGLVIQRLLEVKPKTVGKKGLTLDIINVCIQMIAKDDSSAGGMMSSQFNDEDDDELDEGTPTTIAQRALDYLALHMPSKYLDTHIFKACSDCVNSPDPSVRKAGTVCLGVIAEGCADRLRGEIDSILPHLYRSAEDPNPLLREASCFALGQWAEHLQPDILDHYETLLPVVFKLLDDSTTNVKGTSCYVLESLTENMEPEAVLPYLDALMSKLVALVQTSKPQIQLMAISAIGSTAVGAEKAFEPYFMPTAQMLNPFLQITDEKHLSLRGRALECMGYLAIAVGKDTFEPVFHPCMEYALQSIMMQDMELSDFCFAFLCNISKVFGEDFSPYLEKVLPLIAATIATEDGMTTRTRGDSNQPQLASFNDSDDEYADDETGHGTIVSVRTAMLDMKAGAVSAIQSMAEHTGAYFEPFIPSSMQMLSIMTTYFHESARSAAIASLCQLVIVSSQARPMTSEWVQGKPNAVMPQQVTQDLLQAVMTACLEALKDTDAVVVESALDGIVKISDALGPFATAAPLSGILECVLDILNDDHICQVGRDEEDEDDEEEASLLESVCELLSSLARCYGPEFDQYYRTILPALRKYMKGVRPAADRATVFGGIAEVCQELGACSATYAPDLVPVVLTGLTDEESNVRQNCAFCLGIFAQVCGPALQGHYNALLDGLRPLFDDAKSSVADNACAAVARMIMANPAGIPLEKVLPILLEKLPLKQDLSECDTIFKCLLQLIEAQNPVLMKYMTRVVELLVEGISHNESVDEDIQQQIVSCLRYLMERNGAELQRIFSSMSQEQQQLLSQRLGIN